MVDLVVKYFYHNSNYNNNINNNIGGGRKWESDGYVSGLHDFMNV